MESKSPLRNSIRTPPRMPKEAETAPDPPSVTFGRRTLSGRYISYSRDDLESELFSSEFDNYHVHIPMTPDHQQRMDMVPMDPSISARVEEQYVSNSLFTGGFNSVTRAHLMDRVTDNNDENSHPQLAGTKGGSSSCSVPGCDQKLMSDERGDDVLPCECDFKICIDCFTDAVRTGGGICPGCKERYRATELEDLVTVADGDRKALTLPAPPPLPPTASSEEKMERRLSMMKSSKLDFDHNRWLFETKGTYGYGNAIWPSEDNRGGGGGGDDDESEERSSEQPKEFIAKPWRPLTRKLKIPAAILSPYR